MAVFCVQRRERNLTLRFQGAKYRGTKRANTIIAFLKWPIHANCQSSIQRTYITVLFIELAKVVRLA